MSTVKKMLPALFVVLVLQSCNKGTYLNENQTSDLQVPKDLEDLESLLENSYVFNQTPAMGEASSDNYFLDYSYWSILDVKDRNTYVWEQDIYMGLGNVTDWNQPYEQVFYCNLVMNSLSAMEKNTANESRWNNIRGTALFFRSFAFYQLAQLFAPPYDSATAATDLGIPLRLTDNVLEKSVRSSLQETYDRIIGDLLEAKNLLPVEVNDQHPNRPSQTAFFALMAKVFLSMGQYKKAGDYADTCLQLHSRLLDYNSVNANATLPFKTNNPEIIFYSHSSNNSNFLSLISHGTYIDSVLYQSYDTNDLRRSIYYIVWENRSPSIHASYSGTVFPFSGLASDETYLIRAECRARAGKIAEALDDLNILLENRWKRNTYIPTTSISQDELLPLILNERRKELPFRNSRWTDLRRLNKEGANIVLNRVLNGQTYELLPNSARYVLPIPPDVLAMSGIQPNIR